MAKAGEGSGVLELLLGTFFTRRCHSNRRSSSYTTIMTMDWCRLLCPNDMPKAFPGMSFSPPNNLVKGLISDER